MSHMASEINPKTDQNGRNLTFLPFNSGAECTKLFFPHFIDIDSLVFLSNILLEFFLMSRLSKLEQQKFELDFL